MVDNKELEEQIEELTKTIHSMPGIEVNQFQEIIKDFVYTYFAGLFVDKVILKKRNERLAWRLANYYLPQLGELVLVPKGSGDNYLIGEIIDKNCAKCSDKPELQEPHLKVRYLNITLQGKEWIEHKPAEYIIFQNEPLGRSSFNNRANSILKRLVDIWKALGKDMEVSQARLFAQIPFIADETELTNKKKKLEKAIKNGEFLIYASMDGLSPFKFHEWHQDSKEASLWHQWIETFSLFRRMLGMRHFTYKKKERLTSAEAESNEEQFDYIENNMWESRLTALEECKERWKWDFVIKEDELEKLENELAILELKLKIKQTKLAINKNSNSNWQEKDKDKSI